MGIEIDVAYKTWIKEPQKLYRPKIGDKYYIDNLSADIFYQEFSECNCYSYMDKFIEPYFNRWMFDHYKENTNKFIDKLKSLPKKEIENINLYQWLINQQDKMILFDYQYYYSANDMEEFIANRWKGYDEIDVPEDGKTLYMAINNLNHLYNLNLYDSIISAEELYKYDEEDEYCKQTDEKLQKDIKYLLNDIDNYFVRVVKKPNDKYFEDRNERLKIIRNIIEQGGKMVYSF